MTLWWAWTGGGWPSTGPWAKRLWAGKKTGPNPTDRGKRGAKRSLAVEGHGVPVARIDAPANLNDCMLLEPTLEALPAPPVGARPEVCLDKGYDYDFVRRLLQRFKFVAHIRRIGEAPPDRTAPWGPPRRWKVERTLGWLNRWRGLLIRWCKKPQNHQALSDLACAAITLRMAYSLADGLFG